MPRTTRNSLETADARDVEALVTSRGIEEKSLPETPPKPELQTSGLKPYAFTPSSMNYDTNEHQPAVSEPRPHQSILAPRMQGTDLILPSNPSSSPQQYLLSRREEIDSQRACLDSYHSTFATERDPEVLEAARTLLDIYYSGAVIQTEREADESRQTVGSSFVSNEPAPPADTPLPEADANDSSGRKWFKSTPWLRKRTRPVEPTTTAEDIAYFSNSTLEAINSSPAKKSRRRRAWKRTPEEDSGIDMEMGNQDGSTSSIESDTTMLEGEISELTDKEEQPAADEDDDLRDYGPKHLPHFRLENKHMIRRPGRGIHEAPIDDFTSDEPQPSEEAARTKTRSDKHRQNNNKTIFDTAILSYPGTCNVSSPIVLDTPAKPSRQILTTAATPPRLRHPFTIPSHNPTTTRTTPPHSPSTPLILAARYASENVAATPGFGEWLLHARKTQRHRRTSSLESFLETVAAQYESVHRASMEDVLAARVGLDEEPGNMIRAFGAVETKEDDDVDSEASTVVL